MTEKGQTLIVILFVMALALSIGIGMSDRFIQVLRSATRTNVSYRAQAVVEAATERILLKSSSELAAFINFNSCGSDCYLEIVNDDGVVETATITLSYLGNSAEPYTFDIYADRPATVDLINYGANKAVTVCWNNPPQGNLASVTGTLIYKPTSTTYAASSFAYNSANSTYTNGFLSASAANGFQNCFNLSSLQSPQILRLRSVYNDAQITVIPDATTTLPSQGILIEAVGTVLDSTSKVSVIVSNNSVPLPFDYIIFNKSGTQPLAN